MMSSPMGIVVSLLVVLSAFAFATYEEPVAAEPIAPVSVIAERVEAIRGERFKTLPKPKTVSTDEARKDALDDLEKSYPREKRAVDEALYETLGLFPEGTDLKEVSASVFGEQVAGYYDPRDGRLRIVEGSAGVGNRVMDEMIVAHELTHALEDQVFDLQTEQSEASDDPGYAYRALVEGTATLLMYDYVNRHFKEEEVLGGVLASSFAVSSTTPLPRFIMEGLTFPYVSGEVFARELYERGAGSWRLLNVALRSRPPLSTEQVLHPEKWLSVELPVKVPLPGVGEALGEGWEKATEGVFGEWQTAQLIATGGPLRPEASEGWGGDRYELWRRGEENAVVIRWVWDTQADAQEFAPALEAALEESLGRPHLIASSGWETTLVVAPDPAAVLRVLRFRPIRR